MYNNNDKIKKESWFKNFYKNTIKVIYKLSDNVAIHTKRDNNKNNSRTKILIETKSRAITSAIYLLKLI